MGGRVIIVVLLYYAACKNLPSHADSNANLTLAMLSIPDSDAAKQRDGAAALGTPAFVLTAAPALSAVTLHCRLLCVTGCCAGPTTGIYGMK